ncbi:branched-chain amino acid ABC transporter permease [Geodermatophilus sp. YIM 151500]|uniref:branched-chain amino acid ABC transporter permease n=1 Tax=Geodermatophilus sp. YIM 151500 TaxID=2984531 RepID=UPI0021E363F0|nr:branched-chain amino acid ABC transporter permease [Geodermatophilus sp. YIM 151500]MCV2488872.1 branched-chain amino acid ABC transporter permease [Geodermatophilus sp. YIM 151500]
MTTTPSSDGTPVEGAAPATLARVRGSRAARWTWGQLGLLLVLAVIVLFTVPNPSLAIGMLIYGLWAAGLNLLVGYGGLVSFGHALPFAWGGYAAGLVLLHVSTSVWLALLVAVASMALLSTLVGAVCLRRTEVYFSMLTLAFAQLGFFIALQWDSVTGGDDGLAGIPVPTLGLGTGIELNALRDPLTFFLFTGVVVLVTFAGLILFTESPMGRVLQAIRENEERARGCGYNTRLVQLVTFVLAGTVAGLAGGLFAMLNNFVGLQPYWLLSGVVLIMVILGGRSSLFGPVLGAVVYLVLESTLSRYYASWQLIVGAIFMVCVLAFPQGLWGLVTQTVPGLFRRRRSAG